MTVSVFLFQIQFKRWRNHLWSNSLCFYALCDSFSQSNINNWLFSFSVFNIQIAVFFPLCNAYRNSNFKRIMYLRWQCRCDCSIVCICVSKFVWWHWNRKCGIRFYAFESFWLKRIHFLNCAWEFHSFDLNLILIKHFFSALFCLIFSQELNELQAKHDNLHILPLGPCFF